MKTKKKRTLISSNIEFPLASMIDITFLLLIYFVITQKPMFESTHLKATLPGPKDPAVVTTPPKPINYFKISVENTNDPGNAYYYLNTTKMSPERLQEYLIGFSDKSENTTLLIECANDTPHKKLIKLLDMCELAKFKQVSIIDK